MWLRSMLFMPGNREKMLDKSLGIGADAVVWDLEDAVPFPDKPAAREIIRSRLETVAVPATGAAGAPVFLVRINGFTTGLVEDDLQAVVYPGLAGIMMPKVESADEVRVVGRLLAQLEQDRGLAVGAIKIVATLETALGVLRSPEIAMASDRVIGLCFGAEDFTLDVGTSRSREGTELNYARHLTVLACAASKIMSIDTVFSDLNDAEGLEQESLFVRQLGFTGKCAIHPRQLEIINRSFSPSDKEMEYARRVVAAFEQAREAGAGVTTLDGRMLDQPVVERSRRLLERFGQLTQ